MQSLQAKTYGGTQRLRILCIVREYNSLKLLVSSFSNDILVFFCVTLIQYGTVSVFADISASSPRGFPSGSEACLQQDRYLSVLGIVYCFMLGILGFSVAVFPKNGYRIP